MALQERIAISPDRIYGVSILDNGWIPVKRAFFVLAQAGQACITRKRVMGPGVYFVFHKSCAAFTLISAVSFVKGG